ncbi:MAG TPA: tetratricopeptide repeat protein [Bacteroidia bacterium]|nr:tetratricopeptide repeat protein [Bacteroidia bacterium]
MKLLFSLLICVFTFSAVAQNDETSKAKKFFNSGVAFYEKGDFTNAIKDFSKALEFRTKISDSYLLCNLYLNRALCRMYLGSADAVNDAAEAVNLKPEYARSYYVRAMAYARIMHDFDKAVADLDNALSLKPDEPDFLFLKASCYREKKQPKESLKIINQILEADSKSKEALKERGSIYLELHDYETAIKDFTKVLEYEPNNFGSLCNLASCLCELKKFDEALTYYLKAIEADSTEAYVVYNNIGYFINFEQKDYKKAIEAFDKAIKCNPKFGYSYSNKGYAHYMLGDLKTAMREINKSLELAPKNSYAFKNRALVFIAENKISSACLDLQKALDLGYSTQYDDEVDKLMAKHCGK